MHYCKTVLLSLTAILLMSTFVPLSVLAGGKIVSLNKASAEELMAIEDIQLPERIAKAIVAYREANGPFKKPEDLLKVPGLTNDYFEELNPVLLDGDVVYDPDAEPMLAPSKC